MSFQRSVVEIIRARTSCRTFEDRPVEDKQRERLQAILQDAPAGPFGSRIRLLLADATNGRISGTKRTGTYGVIRGARCYIAGAMRNSDWALEDFGYVFEWTVLVATDMGLATCWLGGTFKRETFGQALSVGTDEIVPAVSPIGYGKARRSLVDSTFRFFAASKSRKPWNELFFDSTFGVPLREDAAGAYSTVLEMVRLAPSASNRQPWRIVRGDGGECYHLFLQRTKGYRATVGIDLQRVDMGIGMCHFELSARELGLSGRWESNKPDSGRLPERTEYVTSWCCD